MIASLQIPGLVVDVDYRAQYDWLPTWGLDGIARRAQSVGQVRLGTPDGYVVLNGQVPARNVPAGQRAAVAAGAAGGAARRFGR